MGLMNLKNMLILFSLVPLVLSIGITSSISWADTADYMDNIYREDVDIQCRADLVLVHRLTHNDFLCTDDGTAGRWIQLGIAELARPAEVREPSEEKK